MIAFCIFVASMAKKLSEMSLEELWRLFPISLVPYNDAWRDWYSEETLALSQILPGFKLFHIGSTAVPGIYAKNIVDIMAVAQAAATGQDSAGELDSVGGFASAALDRASDALCAAGWICMSRSAGRVSLNKGYTESGFADRVFHLHLRLPGDTDELFFRDYLREHPEDAKEYESLKLSLCKDFEFNRDGYTNAKSDFVRKITEIAKNR